MRGGAMRVVSLVPSVTETLLAWGLEPVACTRYCEQPQLAQVGGTKNPDLDAIVALHPDLVVMDRVENRRDDAEALQRLGVPVVALHVTSLVGLDAELAVLARAVDVPRPAGVVPDRPHPDPTVRAFVPIWRRPWMTIGPCTYGSEVLASVGVGNLYGHRDVPFPEVTLDDARARRPDVVLAPTEPYAFRSRHLEELERVAPVVEVDGRTIGSGARGSVTEALQRHYQDLVEEDTAP